ncbi:MAG: LLM class flavin-dependent oxidoreductase [Novosphingobium sp.]
MGVRVGVGPGLGVPLAARDYWRWIDLCEDAGIDSIWHSDQLLGQTHEPVSMLVALAARTKRLKFGTNALVAAFRDPILLAKQLATADWLSEGRVFPVLGIGNASDPFWAATGTSPAVRARKSDEAIALLRLLLEQEQIEFSGAHFTYRGPGVFPRPERTIPLWIGGHSPAAYRRTARLGDGWLGGLIGPEAAGNARRAIEAALVETGRTIDSDHYGASLPVRIGPANDAGVLAARQRLLARMPEEVRASLADSFAIGPAEMVIAALRRYVAQGIEKFVVLPMAGDFADLMEQTELLAREIMPNVEGSHLASCP